MSQRPLTVWMLNHYAGNLTLGMEYRHFYLARQLRKMGHDVGIISASFHHLYTTAPEVSEKLSFRSYDGVPFCFLKVIPYRGNGLGRLVNTLQFSWRVRWHTRRIQQRFGRPDIVFASTPHPFVTLNLLHLKRHYGVPAFLEVRDLWPLMLLELGSLTPRHPLTRVFSYLERLGYARADRVISLWHSAREHMLHEGLSADRYLYLPNGIDLTDRAAPGLASESHPLIQEVLAAKRAGKFLIGYGGSHGLANPLDLMVDACRLLRDRGHDDVAFYLVGDGPEKARVVHRVQELGLSNIHLHDYVTKDVIGAFYRRIDVAFMGLKDLPLFKYGPTPNKLMDYLAAAKPIIYAMRSSFDPVAEQDLGVSIPPDDPERLVQAILELKGQDAEALGQMGARGRRYAEEQLDFRTLARRLAEEMTAAVPR